MEIEMFAKLLDGSVQKARTTGVGYLFGAALVAGLVVVVGLLEDPLPGVGLAVLFIIPVLIAALGWGLGPSVFVAVLSVLAYDFFFIEPRYTFSITSSQDLVDLTVFLLVAVLTSSLAARARAQADAMRRQERQTAALYALSQLAAQAQGLDQMVQAVREQVSRVLKTPAAVWLREGDGLVLKAGEGGGDPVDAAAAWALNHQLPAGPQTGAPTASGWLLMPMRTSQGPVGVLGANFDAAAGAPAADERWLLAALAGQAAVAIERATLAQNIAEARALAETERLRTALLSSVSHDLRTPLASIIGAASGLLAYDAQYDVSDREQLLRTIQDEAERLDRYVGNLLGMTRLESGVLELQSDWASVDDLIGAALTYLATRLSGYRVDVAIAPGLPLLRLDFVLMEQVLINLLENATHYAPPGSRIGVDALRRDDAVRIQVFDEGPGAPSSDLARIFDKFYRVQSGDHGSAGLGLGLSICKGIVEAHEGRIWAERGDAGRGLRVIIELPVAEIPAVEPERETADA
jgi:two-component system sensor histidine kinase KdpD